jgi:hypothetical protein
MEGRSRRKAWDRTELKEETAPEGSRKEGIEGRDGI